MCLVAQAQQCPQGWYGNKDKCYFLSATTVDWNTAKDICKTRGAILASIENKDEAVSTMSIYIYMSVY